MPSQRTYPTSILEKHVTEFHGILGLLSEPIGEGVTPFLIASEEVNGMVGQGDAELSRSCDKTGNRIPMVLDWWP
jgi:hypothetical protein